MSKTSWMGHGGMDGDWMGEHARWAHGAET